MMEIGGYLGLELKKGKEAFHDTPYRLKSGRSSLSFILQHLQPKKVYVPFYTCDALLEPLILNNISYSFYAINRALEVIDLPKLEKDELIIYVNYYDLKRNYIEHLSKLFEDKLIVDCTQSYFLKGNNISWYFNSSRKFFGVPDGSDMYIPSSKDLYEKYSKLSTNEDYITDHLLLRFNDHIQEGHHFFRQNEILNNSAVKKVSKLSDHLLSNVCFDEAIEARKENFNYLNQILRNSNQLLIEGDENITSNFYPYLRGNYIDKKVLWERKIFVPVLWPECISRNTTGDFSFEKELSKNLIPIPTDHRYCLDDMKTIATIISQYYE